MFLRRAPHDLLSEILMSEFENDRILAVILVVMVDVFGVGSRKSQR